MRTMRLASVACVALLFLGAGCRDRSSVQDKEDTLCVEMGELDQTVTKIASLAASAGNPAQLGALRAELESRYRDTQEAAKDVSSFRIDPLAAAYDAFVKTLAGVNNPATLAAAQPKIDLAASNFATVRLDLYNTAGCS